MSDGLLHPEFETLSPAEVTAWQDDRWRKQWPYVRSRSAFYRSKLPDAAPDDTEP